MPDLDAQPSHEDLKATLARLEANIASVFLGKPDVVKMSLVALLADGHLLLEDVPGVGKTLLAKALAKSLKCSFHRIQFTPDLLPGDLLGTSIFHQPSGEFRFQEGPLFAQVVLADEINRATPRTQSALLEAMSERQVTLDGKTRKLDPPFLVLATQNPYEFAGTYPLPESQLDRFLLRIKIGYPDRTAEHAILTQHRTGEPVDALKSVIGPEDILKLQRAVRAVRVESSVSNYILDLVHLTRDHKALRVGASTRAALALYRAGQALALCEGRDYVLPDDIKTMAEPVLAHRLLTHSWGQDGHDNSGPIVQELLASLTVVGS